jgi:hypothetical protein
MKAIIENINIRGCEPKENKKGEPYLLVRFEDEYGKASELVDKDMERQPFYKRNTDGTLIVDIEVGRYTSIRIVDFKAK